jgi:hypothetical protein
MRPVMTAGALLAGAVLASGCNVQHESRLSPAPGSQVSLVVPWKHLPAMLPPLPPPPMPPGVRHRPCKAADLRAKPAGGRAALGILAARIEFVNIASTPCTLAGYPRQLIGIRKDGELQMLLPFHGTMFDDQAAWPANLKPGDKALMIIATGDNCAALNRRHPTHRGRYVGELVDLPGGGQVRVGVPFDTTCGLDITRIGRPVREAPEPHAYRGLRLSVDRPSTVLAGSIMRFTITLTNRTAAAIELHPCPVYREVMYVGGHPHGLTDRLNCEFVKAIRGHSSQTYSMRFRVPLTSGIAKFSWRIPTASLFSGGTVTVER